MRERPNSAICEVTYYFEFTELSSFFDMMKSNCLFCIVYS